ncbi:uncharacterized protein LOC124362973 [Homalodisca vitripennis]|uniref:uncharacterized protein LOC124362973 n=1 Tax=Homalodisca vitripennis TaxID=197043 RepID=UPI001EEB01E8|nr:uncharacterized protein LOC124362973 [Homalodisca vitripennis]
MDNIKIPYLPELETCCGCLSLREGAKMFGVISLLGSIYMCLEIFATIIMISVNPDYVAEGAGILLFAILVHSVHIGTSASLLFGVYKERNKPMFGWLITAVMVALLEAFVVPSIYIRVLIFHKLIEVNYKLVLVTIIMLIDDIYGWLVVVQLLPNSCTSQTRLRLED